MQKKDPAAAKATPISRVYESWIKPISSSRGILSFHRNLNAARARARFLVYLVLMNIARLLEPSRIIQSYELGTSFIDASRTIFLNERILFISPKELLIGGIDRRSEQMKRSKMRYKQTMYCNRKYVAQLLNLCRVARITRNIMLLFSINKMRRVITVLFLTDITKMQQVIKT